jgi:cell wall-associated NlpC family hydrolase
MDSRGGQRGEKETYIIIYPELRFYKRLWINHCVMKKMLVIVCLLCVNLLYAQEKELEKIRKNFTSGKYEKTLKLCDKSLSVAANKKNPELYFYKSLSTFKQADSTSSVYYKMILSSLAIAAKGKPYDRDSKYFTRENSEFNDLIGTAHKQSELKYYTNKTKDAKFLEGMLARSFKDTSELYYVLYNIEKKKVIEEITLKIAPLKSNAGKLDSIIYFAFTHVGKEYKFGKEGPDAFDCSGFIGYVFKHYGEKLPHNANMISKLGEEVPLENIKKGDLIFFGSSSAYHVAMYVAEPGDNPKIIHCVSRGVCIDSFDGSSHWGKSNVYKVKRMIK